MRRALETAPRGDAPLTARLTTAGADPPLPHARAAHRYVARGLTAAGDVPPGAHLHATTSADGSPTYVAPWPATGEPAFDLAPEHEKALATPAGFEPALPA